MSTPLDVIEGRARWCVVEGDAMAVLASLPDGCTDAVVTDEPYGLPTGSAFVRRGGADVADRSAEAFNVVCEGWVPVAARLVVEGGYLATFTSRQRVRVIEDDMAAAGLTPWQKFYIVKPTPAPTPRPVFMQAVEECIMGYRGPKRGWYGGGGTSNAWIGKTPNALGVGVHPTQKPLEAMRRLVRALAPPGGLVLDCFCGSGTTGEAALLEGRRVILVERDAGHAATARRRCAAAEAGTDWKAAPGQGDLFGGAA